MKNLFDFGLIDPLEEKHEHRMAETSIQAYHTVVKPNLGHMHKIIHEIIINNPGCSNADILNILNKEHPRSNGRRWRICSITAVSYTHLTLPTILLV